MRSTDDGLKISPKQRARGSEFSRSAKKLEPVRPLASRMKRLGDDPVAMADDGRLRHVRDRRASATAQRSQTTYSSRSVARSPYALATHLFREYRTYRHTPP